MRRLWFGPWCELISTFWLLDQEILWVYLLFRHRKLKLILYWFPYFWSYICKVHYHVIVVSFPPEYRGLSKKFLNLFFKLTKYFFIKINFIPFLTSIKFLISSKCLGRKVTLIEICKRCTWWKCFLIAFVYHSFVSKII